MIDLDAIKSRLRQPRSTADAERLDAIALLAEVERLQEAAESVKTAMDRVAGYSPTEDSDPQFFRDIEKLAKSIEAL